MRKLSPLSWVGHPSHSTWDGPCGPFHYPFAARSSRGIVDVLSPVATGHQDCAMPTTAGTGPMVVTPAWQTVFFCARCTTATCTTPAGKSSFTRITSTSSHQQSSTPPAPHSTTPSAAKARDRPPRAASTLRPHFMAALTGGLPTPAGPRRSIGRPRARTPSSAGHRTHSPAGRLRAGVPTRVSAPRNASGRSRRAAHHQLPAGEGHPKGAARSPGTRQDGLGQRDHRGPRQRYPGHAQAVDRPRVSRLVDDQRRVVAVVVGALALDLNPATLTLGGSVSGDCSAAFTRQIMR
jgi:hypothetical protein